MTREELQRLLDPNAMGLIEKHTDDDPAAFALKHHNQSDLPVRAIAEQIACRRKAAKKLPKLSHRNLLYTALSLEQASGERTAFYKSGLEGMSGEKMLDMTGGLGIDSIFFARRFDEVVYVERDEVLAEIASRNFKELGIRNISVTRGDSVEMLKKSPDESFDWIYIDPARREKRKRSVALEETVPNIVELHDLLLRKTGKFCVKASPALEISGLREKLASLSQILVLSVDRECRETVLFCERGEQAAASAVVVKAVCLAAESETVVGSRGERVSRRHIAGKIGEYFYEPDPAIIKARLSEVLAEQYEMQFINPSVDYLTSDKEAVSFPGRIFRVKETFSYRPKSFRRFLKNAGITAAGIQRRDFPLSPDELRRIYSLKESDRQYLFFSKDSAGKLLCLFCERRV